MTCLAHCILLLTYPLLAATTHATSDVGQEKNPVEGMARPRVLKRVLVKRPLSAASAGQAGRESGGIAGHYDNATAPALAAHAEAVDADSRVAFAGEERVRPRRPRFISYPDGTFVMLMFKLAIPIPFCQQPDSPCKRGVGRTSPTYLLLYPAQPPP